MRYLLYFCANPAGKWDLLFDAGAEVLFCEMDGESRLGGLAELYWLYAN